MNHPENQPVVVTLEDLRTVTREAVEQTLMTLGVDVQNPLQMQQDFARLREWRLAMDGVRRRGLKAVSGLLISGLIAALLLGLKEQLQHLLGR